MKNMTRLLYLALAMLVAIPLFADAKTPAPNEEKVAKLVYQPNVLAWHPQIAYRSVTLRVVGPQGFVHDQAFGAGIPAFDLSTQARLADGQYTFELVFGRQPDAALAKALSSAAWDEGGTISDPALRAQVGSLRETLSGTFRIEGGKIVSPYLEEQPAPGTVAPTGAPNLLAPGAKFTYAENLQVQGSLCVGFDCTTTESYGFDTIRLKENNTRIKFEDTSLAGFPSTDWQLTANDSASGGANRFSIEDVTSATVPFTVTGGAPNNSIFVSSTGKVGFRTATPVLGLHEQTSDTPAIRLEQDSSGGFPAQTWDIGANEANFFVRDVTGGSKLPFRIRPGAPTSSIDINASGSVGIGTASPDNSKLHVAGGHINLDDGNALLWGGGTARPSILGNKASGYISLYTVGSERIRLNSSGYFGIGTPAPTHRLTVKADNATNPAIAAMGSASDNQRLYIGYNSTGGYGWIRAANEGTGAVSLALQEAGGNVGIGTANPTSKLHVLGDATVTGALHVMGACCGPDYVFDPSYKLASIEDQAKYMWKNRHLPAVGSARTTEDGRGVVDVFAQSNGMLEELEKAHIYIETLHGEIKALRREAQERDAEVRKELAALKKRLN